MRPFISTLDHMVNHFRQPFQLARRRRYFNGEPGIREPDNPTFDPSEPIKVGDDAIPD